MECRDQETSPPSEIYSIALQATTYSSEIVLFRLSIESYNIPGQ